MLSVFSFNIKIQRGTLAANSTMHIDLRTRDVAPCEFDVDIFIETNRRDHTKVYVYGCMLDIPCCMHFIFTTHYLSVLVVPREREHTGADTRAH